MQYSVVQTTELDKIVFRLDAEYYQPEHLMLQAKLKQFKSVSVLNAGAKLDCSAFYPSIAPYYNFEAAGVPFLRVNEIQNGLLHLSKDTAFLPQAILDNNLATIALCKYGDLIIAKGGNSLAKVALLTKEYKYYSVCRDVIALKTNKLTSINKFYLWMFFHSRVGQKILLRTASQTGQPHLTLDAIKQIEIPLFSNAFQNIFEWLYKESQRLKHDSEVMYSNAQMVILLELGLTNWQPKHQLTFIKNYSDVQKAERIDAEYYQLKYDGMINAIKNYSGGWGSLGNLINLKDNNYLPINDKEYKYIELSNITGNGEITGGTTEIGYKLPSRARRKVVSGDVIVSSIEGSLSSIALVGKEYNQALCSTGFYVVDSDNFNPETLLVLMKSIVGQMLLKKGCSGTILTAINKDEFLNMVLPKLEPEIQTKIQKKVAESFNLRKQSKHLLESAKKAVEMAIEQDEQTAIEWLEQQTSAIDLSYANGL